MDRDWGSGENWQEAMTKGWIKRLASNAGRCEIAVLEGQTRPSFIEPSVAQAGITHARIVLLDCTGPVRLVRLRDFRAQPELANDRMDAWAAYLRSQAEARGLRVLETSVTSVEAVADALEHEVSALRNAAAATWRIL